jgi:PEP-CTERM motif
MKTQVCASAVLGFLTAIPAFSSAIIFSNDNPNGLMAVASNPGSGGTIEREAADDFLLTNQTLITSATFTGLLPAGAALSSISDVTVEIYRVFPLDSGAPSGNVLTRVNSPSDVAFASRDSAASELSFTTGIINASFASANSVVNGINKFPNQTTGGEGGVSGEEVQFTVTFATPFNLPADHYFFVPQVGLSNGNFLWLSATRPIVGQFAFSPDLQGWIRDANLDPDWSRIGTDIVGPNGQNPAPQFNFAFSLTGTAVPEPSTIGLILSGIGLMAWRKRSR